MPASYDNKLREKIMICHPYASMSNKKMCTRDFMKCHFKFRDLAQLEKKQGKNALIKH